MAKKESKIESFLFKQMYLLLEFSENNPIWGARLSNRYWGASHKNVKQMGCFAQER